MNQQKFFDGFRLARSSFLRWIFIFKADYCQFRSNRFWLSLQNEKIDWKQHISDVISVAFQNRILEFQKDLSNVHLNDKPRNLSQVKENVVLRQDLHWDSGHGCWAMSQEKPSSSIVKELLWDSGTESWENHIPKIEQLG